METEIQFLNQPRIWALQFEALTLNPKPKLRLESLAEFMGSGLLVFGGLAGRVKG